LKKALTGNQNPAFIGPMKIKPTLISLAVFFAAATVCSAANPFMGTWKLNEAKSKLAPGGEKNNTVVYKSVVLKVKVTIDGTDAKGKAFHNEWTGNFDGKDYPVTGDPESDMRSYTKVNDRTMNFTIKNHGKVTITGRIVVAADGKSRTVNTTGTMKGKKVKSTAVYDKA
jgi:hypothetical protein